MSYKQAHAYTSKYTLSPSLFLLPPLFLTHTTCICMCSFHSSSPTHMHTHLRGSRHKFEHKCHGCKESLHASACWSCVKVLVLPNGNSHSAFTLLFSRQRFPLFSKKKIKKDLPISLPSHHTVHPFCGRLIYST